MGKLFDQMDIDKEEIEKIEEESVPEGSLKPAGVYDAVVDMAYIRKTPNGASMLEVVFVLKDDSKYYFSTAVKSGDEKGNKSTWTVTEAHSDRVKKQYGVGTEVQLPGVVEMKHFLDAIHEADPDAVEGDVKHKDETIKALCLTSVQGKKCKLGIRQEESLYNGDVMTRNKVQYWMDAEGKNNKGEVLLEKAEKWLEKNPIKRLKNQPAATAATTGSQASPDTSSGW